MTEEQFRNAINLYEHFIQVGGFSKEEALRVTIQIFFNKQITL